MFNFRKFVFIFLASVMCPIVSSYKMVVLTGGPCGGKSTTLPLLKYGLELMEDPHGNKKYKVLLLNEVATSLINEKITPKTLSGGVKEFQQRIFNTQLKEEKNLIDEATKFEEENPNTECIILCDRGLLDGLAYMDQESRISTLYAHNFTLEKVYNRYDLVIHLHNFASDNKLYSERKESRWEDIKQARELDENLFNIWKYHNKFIEINDIYKTKKYRSDLVLQQITKT